MADWISVTDFIREGLTLAFLTGFASGFIIGAVVMVIRALTSLFRHIVRG